MRYLDGIFLACQNVEVIRSYWSIDGRRIICHSSPFREELSEGSGLKAVATKYMISDFSSFFDETNINWSIVLFLFLFEFNSCG